MDYRPGLRIQDPCVKYTYKYTPYTRPLCQEVRISILSIQDPCVKYKYKYTPYTGPLCQGGRGPHPQQPLLSSGITNCLLPPSLPQISRPTFYWPSVVEELQLHQL